MSAPVQAGLPGIPAEWPDWQLARSPLGHLVLTTADGIPHDQVVPVRAFPLTAPQEAVALVGPHGEELAWIETLAALPGPVRILIEATLADREFMPALLRIVKVSSFATPSTWTVETDHGPTDLVLRGEEDIRRLAGPALLVADSNGLHYRIADRWALDPHSRSLLDRFL